MFRGHLPSRELLQRFPVLDDLYTPFITAIRTGDIRSYDASLDRFERRLVDLNLYLTLEKARELCIRGLFRRVCVVLLRVMILDHIRNSPPVLSCIMIGGSHARRALGYLYRCSSRRCMWRTRRRACGEGFCTARYSRSHCLTRIPRDAVMRLKSKLANHKILMRISFVEATNGAGGARGAAVVLSMPDSKR